MDLQKVLAQLRSDLENVDAAIQSLERLQLTERRRGRPPSWMAVKNKPGRGKRGGKSRRVDGPKTRD